MAYDELASSKIAAIYLFELGSVKDLRKTFNIGDSYEDTDKVYSFGAANDFGLRTCQHKMYFDDMFGIKVVCTRYVAVEPAELTDAEYEMKRFFIKNKWCFEQDWRLDHSSFWEMVIISDNAVNNTVYREFSKLGDRYAGCIKPFKAEVDRLTRMLEDKEKKEEELKALFNKQIADTNASCQQQIEMFKEIIKSKDEFIKINDELIKTKEAALKAKEEALKAKYDAFGLN